MKLLKRLAIIARYFFLDGTFSNNLKKHQHVKQTLDYFITNKLIKATTKLIYLRKYVSNSLTICKSCEILSDHYSFLKTAFSGNALKYLFIDGIVCYAEDKYKILLGSSKDNEREGSLSLYFMDEAINIATLSFTVSSGKTFEIDDKNIVIISRYQQINAHLDNIKVAKKHFQDIMPTVVLFTTLEAICVALNIKKVLGIHGKDQISYQASYDRSYVVNYDEFWMHNGGTFTDFGYVMNCPFPQKDLLEIKQTHRNRAKKKRDRLDAIYNYCYAEINKLLVS